MSDYILVNGTLYHHGIKGQKWGQRNYQNPDGSYTAKGQAENNGHGRYSDTDNNKSKAYSKEQIDNHRKKLLKYYQYRDRKQFNYYRIASDEDIAKDLKNKETVKKALIVGAAAVGVSAAIYLAYKHDVINRIKDSTGKDGSTVSSILTGAANDVDFVISQGDTIHRMEGSYGIDITKQNLPSYMAYDSDDVKRYRALLRDWHGTGERFDVEYKALKDIKVPTKKVAKDVFKQLYKDPKFKKQITEDLASCLQHVYKEAGQPLNRSMAILMAKMELRRDKFKMGIYSIVGKGSSSKEYLGELQKRGYDAIVDYFDAGTLGEKPLIMIDPSQTLVKNGESFVSTSDQIKDLMDLTLRGKIL